MHHPRDHLVNPAHLFDNDRTTSWCSFFIAMLLSSVLKTRWSSAGCGAQKLR
jgi:hypothetical protein